MSERRDHVLRARLPWRDGQVLTECGKLPSPAMTVLSLEELTGRIRRLGKTRVAMTTCIICWNQAITGGASWADDPVKVISREAMWARFSARGDPVARTFRLELYALAELARRHGGELAAILAGLDQAPLLDQARRQRRH